jgi:hypothetical protein
LIGQLNAKNGTPRVEVIKERTKEIGQQVDVVGFTFSSGWLHCFNWHHILSQHAKNCKMAERNTEMVEVGRQRLSEIIGM